jgi:hypothetical protein
MTQMTFNNRQSVLAVNYASTLRIRRPKQILRLCTLEFGAGDVSYLLPGIYDMDNVVNPV